MKIWGTVGIKGNQNLAVIFHEASAELIANGYLYPGFYEDVSDWNILYAETEEKIVGFIGYKKGFVGHNWCVTAAYVTPPSREQGIYTKLWNALLDNAKFAQIKIIESSVSVKNTRMIALMEAQGRKKKFAYYEYEVGK